MIRPGLILTPESAVASPAPAAPNPASIDWPVANEAEQFLRQRIARFLELNTFARRLSERMRDETGTDFFEWIDHLVLNTTDEKELRAAGFVTVEAETPGNAVVLHHPLAAFPRVILVKDTAQNPAVIALHPESVADFVAAHSLKRPIEGLTHSRYRKVLASEESGTRLEAVERNAYAGFVGSPVHFADLKKIVHVQELWRTRRRQISAKEGFAEANRLLDESLDLVGKDLSCQFFFAEERRYWESRNFAARVQKNRQDRLGLGWGNHDHHAFHCSLESFDDAAAFLMRLGFQKREGAGDVQILEHVKAGIVAVVKVDAQWCAQEGESFLVGGLHHLSARFIFQETTGQLNKAGISFLGANSKKDFFHEAFTDEQGRAGSHLGIIQRHGGFKGLPAKTAD